MPKANDLTVGMMALASQVEREVISRLTREALAFATTRGLLDNPNGADALWREGNGAAALRAAVSPSADQFGEGLPPVLGDIRQQGHTTLRAIAAELNRRGMMTRRGGQWQVSNVKNLLARDGN